MVKVNNARGQMNNARGRKPRPLFPPGELPLFGPPPAYMRRPPGPPIPPPGPPLPPRGPMHGDYGPPLPPPPPLRPPHLGPPMPPPFHPHPMTMRRRPGPPPPPMPLLQAPVVPPRHLPFMRGRPMPRLGPPGKRLIKPIKKGKNKKNKKPNATSKPEDQKKDENILDGPWINDGVKAEIEKMNELQKKSEESKTEADIKLYNEQKEKVQSLASAAKAEYQTENNKGDYYCEVCDRSWVTEEELESHVSEHVECHFEDCKYTAAPKLVTLHIKLQHESGVFDRIVKSYDTEEVEKWREERRRNYPTLQNIEKKLAAEKEMNDRGERLKYENKPFNREKGFSVKKDGKLKDRKRKRKSINEQPQKFLSTAFVTEDMVVDSCEPVEAKVFSDDELLADEKVEDTHTPPPLSNVLMTLSMSYASDSDGESDSKVVENSRDHETNSSEVGDEAPIEMKISRETDEKPNIHIETIESKLSKPPPTNKKKSPYKDKAKNGDGNQSGNIEWKKSLKKRPLTLLEKLLAKEIKQERSHILQCIRFIVKENFFESNKNLTKI